MIQIKFKISGGSIVDLSTSTNPTLEETSLAVYWLEFLKLDLMSKDFQPDFSIKKTKGDND